MRPTSRVPSAPPVLVRGLTKDYRRQRALTDVDLELHWGEVFGYLGPNGAGKTTTLRVLMGYLRPTYGIATVCGLDAWADAPSVHRQVGYVAGDVALYDRMTGAELLSYLRHLKGETDHSAAGAVADRLGAELDRPLRTLSKGNRQKLAIVQAFIGRPRLLVLDEPTSGLDPLGQEQVHELLREHVDRGGTVLLSSHVLSEVQQVADRVGLILAGRLVTVQRLDELRRASLHKVRVAFDRPVDPAVFAVEGVRDVHVQGASVSCSAAQQALDPLLHRIVAHRVVDFSCEEANLEETFLAFYESRTTHAA